MSHVDKISKSDRLSQAPSLASPSSQQQPFSEAASLVTHQPGMPLSPAACTEFSSRFGFDFGSIRIHSNEEAARSASSLGAQAYTLGRHIVFGRHSYRPDSLAGKAVLAHELSHTVQQWNVPTNDLESRPGLRLASSEEEQQAEQATDAILAHRAPALAPGGEPAIACLSISKKVHSDEDLGDIETAFNSKNDHLSDAQLRKIRNAVRKVTIKAQDWEVLYAFYDYYSGFFGQKIKVMDAAEEAAARAQDRLAETQPDSDTKLRSDVLADTFDDARLGSLLLHEFTHTGHHTNFGGSYDFEEGQSYAIEYFYAEKVSDQARMDAIIAIISAGSVTVASQRAALKDTFLTSYAVMSSLQELKNKGKSPYPILPDLTSDDGDLLMADFVANYGSPSDRLAKIIEYVKANRSSFKVLTLI